MKNSIDFDCTEKYALIYEVEVILVEFDILFVKFVSWYFCVFYVTLSFLKIVIALSLHRIFV